MAKQTKVAGLHLWSAPVKHGDLSLWVTTKGRHIQSATEKAGKVLARFQRTGEVPLRAFIQGVHYHGTLDA